MFMLIVYEVWEVGLSWFVATNKVITLFCPIRVAKFMDILDFWTVLNSFVYKV